ncbi:conserved hypothetical protein [Xanthomonas citri pv. citri]|nr:hypothetical protein [Xanthomonas citri pv. citri]MBD5023968.1 hypothetical protein [Xanthomonas citri pv. citri]CEE30042.1 conserved hypothetical protein [Xanthomonas citri pv. citri]
MLSCCRAPRCVRCVGPLTTRQRCNWATQRRRGDSATPDSGQAGALRHALLSDAQPAKIDAASGIRNRSTQQQAGKQLSNININIDTNTNTNTNTNTQHSTAQHSTAKANIPQHCATERLQRATHLQSAQTVTACRPFLATSTGSVCLAAAVRVGGC